MDDIDRDAVVGTLNSLLELELSGVIRYTQYSLMVFGHARIPIMSWMRDQALESLVHAHMIGEEITTLGAPVSLEIGELVGAHHSHVDEMMREMITHERKGIDLYRQLLGLVEGRSVSLEELARAMVRSENVHVAEIEKMLKTRGDA